MRVVQRVRRLKMERGAAQTFPAGNSWCHRRCEASRCCSPTLEMFVQIYKPFRILRDLFYCILEPISRPIRRRRRHHRRRRLRFHLKIHTRMHSLTLLFITKRAYLVMLKVNRVYRRSG